MSNSDTAVQNNRVPIPGSDFSMPSPPPVAHWTVYKITGPDGKVYIGQTGLPLKIRWRKGYHLSDKSARGAIKEAMLKYGKENFSIEPLCENLTQEGAWELEAKFIELYDSMNPEKGYNAKTGGSDKGCVASDASREKVSRSIRKKYRESSEYRKAISDKMKRRCAEGGNDAFIYSDKTPRPVQCIETGVIYSSQKEAFRMTGIYHIHDACTGDCKHAGGYHWRFVESSDLFRSQHGFPADSEKVFFKE